MGGHAPLCPGCRRLFPVLSINPYQAFCLFRRGQAYYHIGDYPAALADCESSLDLEPENEGALKFRELVQNKLKM
ncbi:MAG: tetratricopeptide repeat protein [Spirochaetaceae bacterium]|nr:tetratricopeptide repeat protein [Spirochaetaceae bacterium]